MRLILDTHIALWAVTDDPRLSPAARRLIESADNEVVVSVASLWEIGIKHALKRKGKNAMLVSAETARSYFIAAGYHLLAISAAHAVAAGALPRHHGDPFDRMLVAQAVTEPMRLVTVDKSMARYGDLMVIV